MNSPDQIQLARLNELNKSVEEYEKKSRKRYLIFSLVIPSVLLTVYLLVLFFQVTALQNKRNKIEKETSILSERLDELRTNVRLNQDKLDEILNKIEEGNVKEASEEVKKLKKNQARFNFEEIESNIDNSFVSLVGEGGFKSSGNVLESKIRENLKSDENGVVAKIQWDDGVFSSILFLENYKVRVWEEGEEFTGVWDWGPKGNLQVKMDLGAEYKFLSTDLAR